jgi:hypothetical protein
VDLDLHVDAHSAIPICRPGAEPCTDLIERIKRSGYRPLHGRLAAPEPSSFPRARVAPGCDV